MVKEEITMKLTIDSDGTTKIFTGIWRFRIITNEGDPYIKFYSKDDTFPYRTCDIEKGTTFLLENE